MMTGDTINNDNHVSRLCGRSKCGSRGHPLGAAFMLRSGKDNYLSVNWLEQTQAASRDDQLKIIRNHLLDAGIEKLPRNGKLAILHLASSFDFVKNNSPDARELRACREPLRNAPSHVGIYGYGPNDELIADLLAETVSETHPADANVD